jgi:type IV pilus assembly protein PilY1
MATVAVEQQPLIVRASLPPNIVLMLDDSGSMKYDVMPDYDYLSDKSADALIDSKVNGLYYDPTVTYAPPPKADGTFYPDSSFTAAPINGFDTSASATTVNLTLYDGSDDTSDISKYPSTSAIVYSTNTSGNNQESDSFENSEADCIAKYQAQSRAYKYTFTDINGDGDGYCKIYYHVKDTYFRYSTGPSGGTYVVHYVAISSCSNSPSPTNCVVASDTAGVAAPTGVAAGKNIANWFSYYHTRILMAKSGIMNAFSTVDATYRIGFGSIDGGGSGNNNYLNLPALRYTYDDSYNDGSNYIAEVVPFGDGSSSTSQKSALWNWIAKAKADGGTPLRQALKAAGEYYKTLQPWQESASDTAADCHACRLSYTILTTDGFWNGNSPSVGDVDGTAGDEVTGPNGLDYTYAPALPYMDMDASTGTTVTQNFDQCSATFVPGLWACQRKRNPGGCDYLGKFIGNYLYQCPVDSGDGGSGGYSDTLADVAMKYWESDLQSNISNEVPTSTEDPAFWQHMTTFTLGMGFTPKYADQVTEIPMDQVFAWADGGTAITGFGWPKPASDSINNIADMAHAAVNGHGGFYSATTPEAFSSALKGALTRASERVGTGASLAANSTELQTGTVAYQANYFTNTWKGDLKALAVDSATGEIATTPSWTAAGALPAAADRKIYTANAGNLSAGLVAFKNADASTPPVLSSAQLTALGSDTAAQTAMVDYLRGSSADEVRNSGSYRNRTTPLGDIVNSQPIYAGTPNSNQFYNQSFTGSDSFAQFAEDNDARKALIYVAANDGMLHAFDATTGAEAFAYIPAAVITGDGTAATQLSRLADTGYGTAHQYFNDGDLTIADAYFDSGSGTAAWHSVLVGTTGRGPARAIYALDVTNPSAISLLWERSAKDGLTDSKYIGQMSGKPIIAQTADGEWSVLIGNGYNSAANTAALLQFDLDDGDLHVHATDTTADNGLAAPAVWIGDLGSGVSTQAWAGDLQGNVWAFTLNDGTAGTPTSTGSKIFIAKDASGNVQPITGGMLAGRNPSSSSPGDLWLFFGTGRYLSNADLADTDVQTWYGIIVQSATADLAVTSATTRTSLKERHIIAQTAGSSTTDASGVTTVTLPARVVTPLTDSTDMAGKSGWYIDLETPNAAGDAWTAEGERMVTPNQFQGSLLLGTSRVPKATDVCNPSGAGWVMAIDPFTGTNPSQNFFDLTGNGTIDSGDTITVNGVQYAAAGVGFNALPNNPIFTGGTMLTSFDNGTTSSIKTAGSGGTMKRVSWRELMSQ